MKKIIVGLLVLSSISSFAETIECFGNVDNKPLKAIVFERQSNGGMSSFTPKNRKNISIDASLNHAGKVVVSVSERISGQTSTTVGSDSDATLYVSGPNGNVNLICAPKL